MLMLHIIEIIWLTLSLIIRVFADYFRVLCITQRQLYLKINLDSKVFVCGTFTYGASFGCISSTSLSSVLFECLLLM